MTGVALSPAEPPAPLVPLRTWLTRHGEEEIDRLTAYLSQQLPALGAEGPLRDAVGAHLPNLMDLAEGVADPAGGAPLPVPVQRWLGGHGRRGTPLDVVCLSFQMGYVEYWARFTGWVRAEAGLTAAEQAAVLEQGSLRVFRHVAAVTRDVIATYQRDAPQRDAARRARDVADALAGRLDEPAAQERLGHRLAAPHIAFVAWPARPGADGQASASAFARTLVDALAPWQALVVPGADDVRGWLSTEDPDWRARLRTIVPPPGVWLAAAGAAPGLPGFRAAHHEAQEARRVAELTGATVPVLYEDVMVAALCSRDPEQATRFVDRVLGRLAAAGEAAAPLLETLTTFLECNGSPTRAARLLGVHPNTVVKRLDRLERLLETPIAPTSLPLRVAVELAPLVASRRAPGWSS